MSLRSALKRALIWAYCAGIIPASLVVSAFERIDMRES